MNNLLIGCAFHVAINLGGSVWDTDYYELRLRKP
jgi:hypothetical protein